jgi:hypothetical protein
LSTNKQHSLLLNYRETGSEKVCGARANQTLHTDSEVASDDDASNEQPALVDSDSDAS